LSIRTRIFPAKAWVTAVTLSHLATALVVGAAIWCGPALADEAADYPNRPIRLIVPAAPGGISDILARVLADNLNRMFGQSVVVENRGAAGGNLGVEMVAKAEPDGYSLSLIQVGKRRHQSVPL
jgi:tripartite-type tricarboxylate transporter receptor subunit TctC